MIEGEPDPRPQLAIWVGFQPKVAVKARQRRKESKAAGEAKEDWPPYDSAFEAYLAGDFAALHALEQGEHD